MTFGHANANAKAFEEVLVHIYKPLDFMCTYASYLTLQFPKL